MGNSVSTTNLFSDSGRTRTGDDDEDQGLKFVLIGLPRSGKTTFCKQIRFLSGDTLTDEDRQLMESVIERNILENLYVLLKKAKENDQVLECDKNLVDTFVEDSLANRSSSLFASENAIDRILELWNSDTVKMLWKTRDFHIQDTIEHFIDSFDRIKQKDTNFQDYSFMYDRAPGISKHAYTGQLRRRITLADVSVKIRDKLQSPIFKGLVNRGDAVLYFAAMNEFLVNSSEQPKNEGIQASLAFFQDFLRTSTMAQTAKPLLLVFNKTDILHKELHHFQSDQTLVYRKGEEEIKLSYDGPVIDNGISEDVVFQYVTEFFQKSFETVAREEGVYRMYTYFVNLVNPHDVNRLYDEISNDIVRGMALTS